MQPFYKNPWFQTFIATAGIILLITIVWNGLLKKEIKNRERAETLLRESERKFRNVIEASPMGIFLYKLEFHIRPTMIGKITTCLQFITVILVLSRTYLKLPSEFYVTTFYITALFSIISGLHYMQSWFKMMGEGSESRNNIP